MAIMVVEQYIPGMFRKWYDGPVYILDSKCVNVDIGHATYIAFQYIKDIEEFLNERIPRPFAGTIYLIIPEKYHKRLNDKFKELDVRLLTV